MQKVVVAIFLFSGLVFGQALSGSWSAKISLLPPPAGLKSTELVLQGKLWDWTLGGKAEFFGADGWVWQTFTTRGWLGPGHLEWTLLFGPLAPAFLYGLGKASLMLAGLDLSLYSALIGPNTPPYVFTGGPAGGMVLEAKQDLNGVALTLELGFGARKQDITILYSGTGTYTKTMPVDPFPGGLEFTYMDMAAENVPFCCGISLELGFAFTKEVGFENLTTTIKSIPLCCGITFDLIVEFTTDGKTVSIAPRWGGVTGCFTVYGNVIFYADAVQGLDLYGWKIRCALDDCTYAEFLTARNVDKMEEILGEDIFQDTESEYVKLGFCGAGCCGGQWTLDFALFFKPTGSLFGLNRVLLEASVPVLQNLTVDLGLSAVVGAQAGLTAGWTFTF